MVLSGLISISKSSTGEIYGTTEFYKVYAYVDAPFYIDKSFRRGQDGQKSLDYPDGSYDGNMVMGLADLDSPINRFLDSIYDLVFFKDIHGVYRGCNKNFAELLNLPKEQILGRNDYDLYTDEIADIFVSKDQQIFKDLTPRKNEEWNTRNDGSRNYIETLKTPYFGPNNQLMGVLGVSRDITERKLAEERLEENERLLDIYFTQSLSGKFFMMLDHPVKWSQENQDSPLKEIYHNLKMNRINPAMVSLYGISEDALLENTIVKEVFTDIKNYKVQNLVLDLRNNGGGYLKDSHYLYAYLVDDSKAFLGEKIVANKTSFGKSLYNLFPAYSYPLLWLGSGYTYFSTSKNAKNEYKLNIPFSHVKVDKELVYHHNLYVIINGGSYSASALISAFSVVLRDLYGSLAPRK